jgi:N-acetylneuraminic acid mutarotase
MKTKLLSILVLALGCIFNQINAQAVWTAKASLPSARSGVSTFSIGSKGYASCGIDNNANTFNDLWEYDPGNNTWTQKANLGGPQRYSACGFSIGNYGYVTLGWPLSGSSGALNDMWQYDPATNSWTQKASFPGTGRYNAISFVANGKAYVGLGYKPVSNGIYEYDPATNVWTALVNPFPGGARTAACAFTCNVGGIDKGYICTGSLNPDANTNLTHDLWEFTPGSTPGSGTWQVKASFPGAGRFSAFAFSLNNKGYLGGGIGIGSSMYNDFYEYDPIANVWITQPYFPGVNQIHAGGFTINNKGYAATGQNLTTYFSDVYEFAPLVGIDDINAETTGIAIQPNINNGDFTIAYYDFEGKDITVSIMNPAGQLVKNFELKVGSKNTSSHINLNQPAKGVYIVQVLSGTKSFKQKFIVQ